MTFNSKANHILNCNEKTRHLSQADAEATQANRERSGRSCNAIAAYRCPVCGGWHMTKAGQP